MFAKHQIFSCSFILMLISSTTVYAAGELPSTSSYMRRINTSSCSVWSPIRDNYGMSGYACSTYPSSYTAIDGNDAVRVINELEARISALESKIAEMTQK